MRIQKIGMWDHTYPLYQAEQEGVTAKGTSYIQALSNLLGLIMLKDAGAETKDNCWCGREKEYIYKIGNVIRVCPEHGREPN